MLATQLNNALIINCSDGDFWKRPGGVFCCSLSEVWLLPYYKTSQGFVSWGLSDTRNSVKLLQTPLPCMQCWLRLQKEFFTVNHGACQMEVRISFLSHLLQFIAKGCHLAFPSVLWMMDGCIGRRLFGSQNRWVLNIHREGKILYFTSEQSLTYGARWAAQVPSKNLPNFWNTNSLNRISNLKSCLTFLQQDASFELQTNSGIWINISNSIK